MLDLIYPSEPARFVGELPDGGHVEILPVTEENGVVSGRADRGVCHSRRLLHPVVHLHIIDRYGRVYLQKRSESKDNFPGLWDTAVGGHIGYGEYAGEALAREAAEELGLFDFNPLYIRDYIYANQSEQELVIIYAAVGSFPLNPDNDEVSEGRWWTMAEIKAASGKGIFTPQFEEEFPLVKDKLLSLL